MQPPVNQEKKAKWYNRAGVKAAIAMLLGALLGACCGYLPEEWRAACHLAAKLLGLLGKG